MKITLNVLNDLVPVYLAGEASQDTCTLIEESLQDDAEFARLLEAQRRTFAEQESLLKAGHPALAPDHELQTLARTKGMIERRKWQVAVALMFTVFPLSFAFDSRGIRFLLLRDQPRVAVICWILAALFWVLHLHTSKRLKSTGL